MAKRIVIGTGPDALRAAAALATADHEVTLLTSASNASGRALPSLPVGTGRLRVRAESKEMVEQILGPLVDFPAVERAIAFGGKVHRLPLSQAVVPTLFPVAAVPEAASTWVRARLRNATRQLIGSGSEERSYKDWVVRRMGAAAYETLYRSYAERRWGLPGHDLSVSVARLNHGQADLPASMVAGGEASALDRAERLIRERGGEIRTGVSVLGLRVDQGRVVGLSTSEGDLAVEGPLWVARTPAAVVGWLGAEATVGMRVDAATMSTRQLLQVSMQGDVGGLPSEVHVLDQSAPFFRVVRPAGTTDLAVFHALQAEGTGAPPHKLVADRFVASARLLGIGEVSADSIQVEAIAEHVPVWGMVCHARLRRLLLRFRQLGVVLVGRTGTFGELDPAEEIALSASYRDEESPDQREAHRVQVDPPVLLDDLGAHITRFIER